MPESHEQFASHRSRTTALVLAFFLGPFGAHRYYAGKIGTGILQLVTIGGCGLWWLYDLILVAAGGFRDADGLLISDWNSEGDRLMQPGTVGALFDEVDQLRTEIAQLHERLDFAERLLADSDRGTDHRQ